MLMGLFVLMLATLSSAKVYPDQIRFDYQPHEFKGAKCKHWQIRDLPDWKVVCENEYYKEEFTVHLIVRKHKRGGQDDAFEVLYWVSRKTGERSPREHQGTSMVFVLNGSAQAKQLRIGQSVKNDYAHLNLSFRPKGFKD